MNDTVSFGYEDIDATEKTGRVGEIFSSVASKYDIMNDAMSGGMHRLWKNRFVSRVKPQPGEQILDMAGGTGDIAFRMADKGASVTVSDINQDMLDVGIERAMERGIDGLVWSCQNAEELTFSSRTFDAYTIVFGIRNVTYIDKALKEALGQLHDSASEYAADQSGANDPRCGVVQPITVADGEALNDALRRAAALLEKKP